VDLVGTDEEPVPQADLSDRAELLPAEGASHRVMGIAEEEEPGSAGDCPLQVSEVENPAAAVFHEVRGNQIAESVSRCAEKGRVDRHGAENLITVVSDCPAGQVEAGYQARQPDNPFFLDAPVVFVPQMRNYCVGKSFQRSGVTENSMLDPFTQGIDNRLG